MPSMTIGLNNSNMNGWLFLHDITYHPVRITVKNMSRNKEDKEEEETLVVYG